MVNHFKIHPLLLTNKYFILESYLYFTKRTLKYWYVNRLSYISLKHTLTHTRAHTHTHTYTHTNIYIDIYRERERESERESRIRTVCVVMTY